MLADVIFVALTLALMVWGYKRGVSIGVLVAVGFALGALFGSRVGPGILARGLHDPLAPAVALPAALLMGGVFAMGAERLGYDLQRYLRRRYTLDSIAGALLGAFLGVVLAWVVGIAAAQVDGLKDTVRGSEVITQLNAALPPPGPVVNPDRTYDIRLARGPDDRSATPGDRIKHARAVEDAALSVVKIDIIGCEGTGKASGWIAASGIVVTNAHVPYRAMRLGVRVEGAGRLHRATPISFDVRDDISVLRAPGVRGIPSLRVGPVARKGQLAAVLGFPFGGRYKARAARIGRTSPRLIYREPGERNYLSDVTRLRSDIGPGPGSSGGPIVDEHGRVVAMTSAGDPRHFGRHQFAVPSSSIRRDLKRALASPEPGVDTGDCASGD